MKAQKLVYNSGDRDPPYDKQILLGRVIEDSDFFIVFQTGKGKRYTIGKSQILSLTETDQEYIDRSAE